MKFTAAAITSGLLLASTAIAAPSIDRRLAATDRRVARRTAFRDARAPRARTSLPKNKISAVNSAATGAVYSGETSTSTNWGGAEVSGDGISAVSGTVNVPTPYVPPGGSMNSTYAGTAWVGIDGGDGCDVIIQTGFDWSTNGATRSFSAWYEWYPNPSYTFDIEINEGDSINMRVETTSASSGTMYITNESTGQSVQQTLSGQKPLCEAQGEWIVEDFSVNNQLVPFAEFSPVSFTDCSLTTSSGTVGVSGADLVTLAQGDNTLVSCSVDGDSTVNCQYGS